MLEKAALRRRLPVGSRACLSCSMATLGLSEIVLVVKDVAPAAAFYRDVVGLLPARPESDEWAWFFAGAPGGAPFLAVHKGKLLFEEKSPLSVERGGQRPLGHAFGQVHFALEVARSEIDGEVARVRSKGVDVFGPVRLEWMSADSWYFYDPDGNLVEFWVRD